MQAWGPEFRSPTHPGKNTESGGHMRNLSQGKGENMLKEGLMASLSVMVSTNLKKKRLRVPEIKEDSRCEAVKLWRPHSHGHLCINTR